MHVRFLIAATGALATVLVLAACGGGKSAGAPTTTAAAPRPSVSHAAPGLEALLPETIDGHRLAKGSATGAVVLAGNNAFSSALRRILAGSGKQPSDLLFANAQDPTGRLGLEVGVLRVHGLAAPALRDAIVRSSRPNAPGLAASRVVLGGTQVTKVVYPGGSTLYLYAHDGVVNYVGTQDEALTARTLRRLR